jgi:hypothetical protein
MPKLFQATEKRRCTAGAVRPAQSEQSLNISLCPPGEVESVFFSAAPAVFAPCVLASLEDDMELPLFFPRCCLILRGRSLSDPALPWLD